MISSRTVLIGVVALLFLSSFAVIGTSGAASYSYVPPFRSTISLPSTANTNQNVTFYVNDTNGFSNYTVTVYIGADNLTGLSPLNSVHQFQATNPDFKLSFKAPSVAQNIYITVVSAANYGNQSVTSTTTYQVTVVTPIVFHAVVRNSGSNPIYNLTVDFTLNGQLLPGNVTVPVILPNQQITVNYTYPFKSLSTGSYALTVTTEGNPLVTVNGNAGSSTSHFYYGTPPNYTWIYYIVAVVVILMAFIAFTAGKKPPAGARAPKWRRSK